MKIAVVGSGISGMAAAYLLSKKHEVDLYEKENKPGGHSRTIDISRNGKTIPIDTGFLVYNLRTYPLLTRLFDELKVKTDESNMSFSVFLPDKNIVYNGNGAGGIFFQKKNLLSPDHYRMIRDIIRFNRRATRDMQEDNIDEKLSLGDYADKWSAPFRERYLYPMGASIWSSPLHDIKEFPALAFLRFFFNHGLLTVFNQPVWRTVHDGSRQYVEKILKHISGQIHIGESVTQIKRSNGTVELKTAKDRKLIYDHVVLAAHAPDSLQLLSDADEEEKNFLSSFQYRENLVVTHGTPFNLYPDKRVWSSWNYYLKENNETNSPILTYWINLLQNPDTKENIFVTLNDKELLRDNIAEDSVTLSHPLFDRKAIDAQKHVTYFDGRRNTWFCGAWQRNGFHEDGLWSANRVAGAFECEL